MVSSKLTAELKRAFDRLQNASLDIHQYPSPLFDIVFEIISADTFVAGIASRLIDGDTVGPDERAIVEEPLLVERRWWKLENGQLFDLQPYPELSEAALAVESLRLKCKEAFDP